MTKSRFLTLIFLVAITQVYGQGRVLLGQYFQNLPAFSPAFTGANNYLDIRTGFRKQWAGFDGAPNTIFLSAYSPIGQSDSLQKRHSLGNNTKEESPNSWGFVNKYGVKLGAGGYLFMDERGPLKELEIVPSLAVHVPVWKRTHLSLGISGGLWNSRIDLSEITVVDEVNDATYLSYLNDGTSASYLHLNFSLGIYSDRYYFSYGMMQAARTFLSGNDQVNDEGAGARHHLLGGYHFFAGPKWELIPNSFLRIEGDQPLFFETGLRARYNRKIWIGASYRNDETIVSMFGFSFNDLIDFGYAYEHKNSDFDNFNSGSHEVILGLKLFKRGSYSSIW